MPTSPGANDGGEASPSSTLAVVVTSPQTLQTASVPPLVVILDCESGEEEVRDTDPAHGNNVLK